jgi:hypothetical protein
VAQVLARKLTKQLNLEPYVLEQFQTKTKVKFIYDDPIINFLYMNGVVSVEEVSLSESIIYLKRPTPKFVVGDLSPIVS